MSHQQDKSTAEGVEFQIQSVGLGLQQNISDLIERAQTMSVDFAEIVKLSREVIENPEDIDARLNLSCKLDDIEKEYVQDDQN